MSTLTIRSLNPLLLVVIAFCASGFSQAAKVIGPTEGAKVILGKRKSPVVFKVNPEQTGSEHFTIGTEDLAPGTAIPTHKHLEDEEVLFVHQGNVEIDLGNKRVSAKAGSTIFVPPGAWIGVKNTEKKTATVVWMFPRPGFEHYLADISRAKSAEEAAKLDAEHKIVYK